MNPPADIGNSISSDDDVSALTSITHNLNSSNSTANNNPTIVYMSLQSYVPVEDQNSTDVNIILDFCELRK